MVSECVERQELLLQGTGTVTRYLPLLMVIVIAELVQVIGQLPPPWYYQPVTWYQVLVT